MILENVSWLIAIMIQPHIHHSSYDQIHGDELYNDIRSPFLRIFYSEILTGIVHQRFI